ncbi:GP179 protein, partial [Irena cyanogastra]|nr:GP179 protein [Irena cyanogastra]
KALEKGSRERESICPWESQDMEQPLAKPQTESSALPKAAPEKSQSSEKAEICPWDAESSSKAEICPWEVAEPPCQQPKAKQVPAGGSKGDKCITRQAALASPERSLESRDRESVCPWESQDTQQPLAKPQTGSSALPKAAPGKSQSSEKAEICPWESQDSKSSDKAEICPWESQDSKPSSKAEICPWEVAEPQLEKRTAPGKERVPGKETNKALEKG